MFNILFYSALQPNTTPNHQENHIDLDDGMTLDDDDFFKGFPEDEIPELNDLLGLTCPVGSPGSPKNNSAPGSPMVGGGGHNSPTQNHNNMGSANMVSDPQDDPPNLLQQPLAMGFYVSTSPTGPLPRWFWSACPHRENICPTCFKVGSMLRRSIGLQCKKAIWLQCKETIGLHCKDKSC